MSALTGALGKLKEENESVKALAPKIGADNAEIKDIVDTMPMKAHIGTPSMPQLAEPPTPAVSNPWAAFGSAASVLGVLGSGLLHLPIYSALNAAAGAIRAQQQGDEEAYKQNYQRWRDSTDLAIKQAKWEQQKFEDYLDEMKTNAGAAQAKIGLLAQHTHNMFLQAQAAAGIDPATYGEYLGATGRAVTALEAAKTRAVMEDFMLQRGGFLTTPGGAPVADPKSSTDPASGTLFQLNEKNLLTGVSPTAATIGGYIPGAPLGGQATAEARAQLRNDTLMLTSALESNTRKSVAEQKLIMQLSNLGTHEIDSIQGMRGRMIGLDTALITAEREERAIAADPSQALKDRQAAERSALAIHTFRTQLGIPPHFNSAADAERAFKAGKLKPGDYFLLGPKNETQQIND